MSSILKALEKVERERLAQRDGISESFLKPRQQRSRWMLPVGIVSGAAFAALVTFAAMGGFSRHRSAPVAAVPPATVAAPAATPSVGAAAVAKRRSLRQQPPQTSAPIRVASPAETATAGSAGSSPAVAGAVPAPIHKRTVKVAVVPAARTRVTTKMVPANRQEPLRESVPRMEGVPAAQPAPVASSPAAASAPLPELRVTGIAVQNEGTSFAIVNGRPVAKGGSVEGCRIEEIHQDRVKFSSGARHFDVPLEEEAR